MSYNLDINKPSGKTSQIYYFKHPWEPKHAIGKQHCKRREFLQNDGIAEVKSLCDYYTKGHTPEYYGKFVINGKAHAVDKLMLEISDWLKKCQNIHYSRFYY